MQSKIEYGIYRVLIVDDDPMVHMALTSFLEQIGCVVVSATNGKEALKLINEIPLHMVFLDIHMPKMSGLEVAQAIRKLEKSLCDLPLIGITAESDEKKLAEAKEAGMNETVGKPTTPEILQRLLKVYAGKKQQE